MTEKFKKGDRVSLSVEPIQGPGYDEDQEAESNKLPEHITGTIVEIYGKDDHREVEMQIYHNGKLVSPAQAVVFLGNLAFRQGMDQEEIMAIWERALSEGEDGEYARDDLSSITDEIEIVM